MQFRTSLFAVLPMLVALACSAKNDAASKPDTATPAASAAPTDEGAVRRAIDSANTRFIAAIERGDSATAVASYADDAVIMMPNDQTWRGLDAARKGFAGFLSQASIKNAKASTDDVMVRGDLAVETGHYEWTIVPKGGKEMKDKGKYLTVWKRQADGAWKIVRDINNSDLPAKM